MTHTEAIAHIESVIRRKYPGAQVKLYTFESKGFRVSDIDISEPRLGGGRVGFCYMRGDLARAVLAAEYLYLECTGGDGLTPEEHAYEIARGEEKLLSVLS